jgi:hypothetical protein
MMRRWWWSIAFVVGCYRPGADDQCVLVCANTSECPDGFSCSNNRCASTGTCGANGDGGVDSPPDSLFCFGTGLAKPCVSTLLPGPLNLSSSTIDTDTDGMCQTALQPVGPSLCVIASDTIIVDGVVRAQGSRPLVLAANGMILINGTLDARSTRDTKGPGTSTCQTPGGESGADVGAGVTVGGGAAGGTFGGRGGSGGGAGGNSVNGVQPLAEQEFPTFVRGGCEGGPGGLGPIAVNGPGGAGGGALYVIANLIDVSGRVLATGAGAFLEAPNFGSKARAGGGGGGSGGMIVLDAASTTIAANARALAHGGAGAGGGGTLGGGAGEDPDVDALLAANIVAIGGGGSGLGGAGGSGSGVAAGGGANDGKAGLAGGSGSGGGGGGGGAGFIRIYCSSCAISGLVIPPPELISP